MKNILLFDMDGVLLEPRGYHRALQETVQTIGESLGFKNPQLSQKEIYAFEAAGITSEWDSAAIILGLMMREIWQTQPEMNPPDTLPPTPTGSRTRQPPQWRAFLTKLGKQEETQRTPRERAAEFLKKDLSSDKQEMIENLVAGAHEARRSITHRTFQEFVLGSERFQKVYQLRPQFNCRSYLEQYDRPLLSSHSSKKLSDWLNNEGQSSAILTNRPSQPLEDHFGTPEAEMGAALVGLEDLPIIGHGEIAWLAEEREQPLGHVRKPSPVHTLAALLVSLGTPKLHALQASDEFVHDKQAGEIWQNLHQNTVYVFEDTPPGFQSARSAQEILDTAGFNLDLRLIGIAVDEEKGGVLRNWGGKVYPNIDLALREQILTL
ncbi:MAG: hypothetical protein R6U51_08900 [Anaerolineales bacterium]